MSLPLQVPAIPHEPKDILSVITWRTVQNERLTAHRNLFGIFWAGSKVGVQRAGPMDSRRGWQSGAGAQSRVVRLASL